MPAEQVCFQSMSNEPRFSKYAAQGGKARASVLTPTERSEIARSAARARWGEKDEAGQALAPPDQLAKAVKTEALSESIPLALFAGKLQIGDAEFSVYVLNNGKRVMAQREVVRVLTGHAKGNLGRYIETERLQPYINPEDINKQSIEFKIAGTGSKGTGYEATLLLDICDAYLRAREANALTTSQKQIAKQAEIITRACAKVGITALIDEATGYGPFKRKQDYQLKLQAFIADDLQEWARMFPHEFWFELARLEGIHYSPRNRPLRWGRYVMAFVYDTVDKDIGKKLREINPDPHFKQNHHQWLKEFGRQQVNDHLQRVIAVMKLCEDMEDFKKKFARVFKKSALQTEFNWGGV
jgi:hypothetical protein